MASWREGCLRDQQLYMLDNELYTDCTIRVHGSQVKKEFKLQKAVLARASAVFEAMLLPSGEGMLEARTGVVDIMDMEPDTFLILLDHMYGQAEDLEAEEFYWVERVAVAADRYQLLILKQKCLDRLLRIITLSKTISKDDAWSALRLSDMLPGFEVLKPEALWAIRYLADELLDSEEFVELDHPTLLAIASDARLYLRDSELELITPVFEWAHHHAAREQVTPRAALGEVMSHLRFLNLDSEQFAETCLAPANLALFSPEEVRAIQQAIQNPEELEPLRGLGLSTDSSLRIYYPTFQFEPENANDEPQWYRRDSEEIKTYESLDLVVNFTCSSDFTLVGFDTLILHETMDVLYHLLDTSSPDVTLDGSEHPVETDLYHIKFATPVKLERDKKHTLKVSWQRASYVPECMRYHLSERYYDAPEFDKDLDCKYEHCHAIEHELAFDDAFEPMFFRGLYYM